MQTLNPYDGSMQMAEEWERVIADEEQMRVLLNYEAFKGLIDQMAAEFKARLEDVIAEDHELVAMKKMFDRTLGLTGAKKEINKIVDSLIEEQN